MGRAPAFESDHREFTDALAHILKIARKYNIAPGIHVADEAAAQRRLSEGFRFIAIGSEAGMMLSKAQEIARSLGLGSGKAAAVAKY